MTDYALATDIAAKWGDQFALASQDPATGATDPVRVQAALDAATARMNGFLAQRYNLPVNASPDGVALLKDLCCDLAMGQLCVTPGLRNELVETAVTQALDFLKLVASGRAAIPELPPPGAPAPSPQEAVLIADDRTFTRHRLREF